MRKVQHVFAAVGLAALASLVAFAQAPAPAGQALPPQPGRGPAGPAGPAGPVMLSCASICAYT